MSPWPRRAAFLLAGAAILAVLFAVLGDGDDASPTPAAGPESPLPTEPTGIQTDTGEAGTTAPSPAQSSAEEIRITVRGGGVVGGIRRVTVSEGRQLVLIVRSDVADEVHVHGYDLSLPVAPGTPARIAFRATVPGRFEVELEERGLPIADLQVRP